MEIMFLHRGGQTGGKEEHMRPTGTVHQMEAGEVLDEEEVPGRYNSHDERRYLPRRKQKQKAGYLEHSGFTKAGVRAARRNWSGRVDVRLQALQMDENTTLWFPWLVVRSMPGAT